MPPPLPRRPFAAKASPAKPRISWILRPSHHGDEAVLFLGGAFEPYVIALRGRETDALIVFAAIVKIHFKKYLGLAGGGREEQEGGKFRLQRKASTRFRVEANGSERFRDAIRERGSRVQMPAARKLDRKR